MVFKRKQALDLLQKKEAHLTELMTRSESALQMVHDTMENLAVVNQDIDSTVSEIDTYLQRLNDTKNSLDLTRNKNQRIMQNFSKLLCIED